MKPSKIIGQKDKGGITTVSSRIAYKNRWLTVREDILRYEDGLDGLYGVIERGEFAVIAAISEHNHQKMITVIKQYRYPVGDYLWELPMGMWELSPDASPEMIAKGELEEETGLRAGKMIHAGWFYQGPGYSTQRGHVFLASELTQHKTQREATEQNMSCHTIPLNEFERMIIEGKIVCVVSIAAFSLLRMKKLI